MRTPLLGILLLTLAACTDGGKDGPGVFDNPDEDGDGYHYNDDCDDSDATVHPDATEICDADDTDEDCNGLADNADPAVTGGITVYHDGDGDGFGDDASESGACEASTGYVIQAGDCDDANATINPAALETCDAADADEDCNGLADDDDPNVLAVDQTLAWPDSDGDGYGDPDGADYFCDLPDSYVLDDTDCDDTLSAVYIGASEECDDLDNDCDGLVDEAEATDALTWYADQDGDGYGNIGATRVACEQPQGFVSDGTDCDDRGPSVNPAGTERCNEEDDDCDGTVDEDDSVDATVTYRDSDGDGYGDAAHTSTGCSSPSGYVTNDDDCDDALSTVSPSRTEVCDGADTDEDCDGLADDDDTSVSSSGKTMYYADDDGDTYGDPDSTLSRCDLPSGYVSDSDDCDDADATINPSGTEVCDSANDDEDCDGYTDDNDTSVSSSGKTTYYRDADSDGYGTSATTVSRCDSASGYSLYSTDCDDTNAARSPGATEVCDSSNTDEDCDSLADDNDTSVSSASKTTYYRDADSDGYGVSTSISSRCDQPSGYTSSSGDCDDTSSAANPGAAEICLDGIDNDCDGADSCGGTAADSDRRLIGEVAGDYAGWSVDTCNDENNDGRDDLIIGAPYNDRGGTDAGAAYVITTAGSGDLDLSSADAVLIGEDTTDSFGSAVAGVGDVNADSRDDFVIASPNDDDGGTNAGQVYLFRGRITGTTDAAIAYAKFVGESASDQAGATLAGAGDVSGDGRPDFVAGAPGRSSSAGGAYLFTTVSAGVTDFSAATAILTGETASDYAGTALDGAGDVDGDGYDDIVVGAWGDDDTATNSGAAYIVLGPVTGTVALSAADAKRKGLAASDYAGNAVSGGGDLNGDGYDDVLIGANGYGSYGSVFVELGPITSTATLSGADARIDGIAGTFGDALTLSGDLDGDGYDDVAVGDADNDTSATDAGAVYTFLGPVTGTLSVSDADIAITGSTASDFFGQSVAFIGAQDGTVGVWDLLVGGYGQDDGGAAAGAGYTFSMSSL